MQVFSHKVDAVSVALKLQFKNYWKLNAISRDISRVSNLLTNCNFIAAKVSMRKIIMLNFQLVKYSIFLFHQQLLLMKQGSGSNNKVIIIITILWLLLFVMHLKSCGKTRSTVLFLACMVLSAMAFLSFSDSFQRAYNLWWEKPIFFFIYVMDNISVEYKDCVL